MNRLLLLLIPALGCSGAPPASTGTAAQRPDEPRISTAPIGLPCVAGETLAFSEQQTERGRLRIQACTVADAEDGEDELEQSVCPTLMPARSFLGYGQQDRLLWREPWRPIADASFGDGCNDLRFEWIAGSQTPDGIFVLDAACGADECEAGGERTVTYRILRPYLVVEDGTSPPRVTALGQLELAQAEEGDGYAGVSRDIELSYALSDQGRALTVTIVTDESEWQTCEHAAIRAESEDESALEACERAHEDGVMPLGESTRRETKVFPLPTP